MAANQKRSDALFDDSPVPMWVFDAETLRFLAVNQAAIDTYGYTRRQFLNRRITDIRPPDEVNRLTAQLKELPASEISGAWKNVTRDGRVIDVLVSSSSITFEGRAAVLASVRDVTTDRQRERALQASEERFRKAFNRSPVSLVIARAEDQELIDVNETFLRTFGYKREEVIGKSSVDLGMWVNPEDRNNLAPTESGHPRAGETALRAHDGTLWHGTLGIEDIDVGGEMCVLISFYGAAERLLVEEALERSRSLPLTGNANVAQRYAARLRTLHAIDRSILQGGSVEEIVNGALDHIIEAVGSVRASVVRYAETDGTPTIIGVRGAGIDENAPGTAWRTEAVRIPMDRVRDGPYVSLDLSNLPMEPAVVRALQEAGLRSFAAVALQFDGAIIGALAVWYEKSAVTDEDLEVLGEVGDQLALAMKQAGLIEEIRRRAQELEIRVQERTLELKVANEELQSFAYSVSHDLRAPLRAMHGFGQALLEDYGDEMNDTARDFTRRIIDASSHMDNLIQDLLSYSRVAHVELDLQPVALAAAAQDAIEQLKQEISDRGAAVSVKCRDLKVMAHQQTVVQVIVNLVSNGIKFVPEGNPPAIGITAGRSDGFVRLSVTDNGIGVEPQHADRIFGLFERLHGLEEYPGTGIGLAIVKRSTERMGGRVGLQSTPGKGSTFWLELPTA